MDKNLASCLVFGLGGLIGLIWYIRTLWLAIRSKNWDRVNCEITESRITIYPYTWYYPIISYKYTIDGLHYTGKRIQFGGIWHSYSNANDYCESYIKGEIYQVSVDPNDLRRSVLEPGASWRLYSNIIGCIALIASSVIWLLVYLNQT
jgi:Protein of unknown function (DUF3592)